MPSRVLDTVPDRPYFGGRRGSRYVDDSTVDYLSGHIDDKRWVTDDTDYDTAAKARYAALRYRAAIADQLDADNDTRIRSRVFESSALDPTREGYVFALQLADAKEEVPKF